MISKMRLLTLWISLILTVSIGMGAMTSFVVRASSDSYNERYHKAALTLRALGIMDYSEETVKPGDLVTRGEFVKRIISIIGMKTAKAPENVSSRYEDVSDNELLYCAQIAFDLNLMRGTSDTEFSPALPMPYEQAVTVIVRVLGFEPYAEAGGGYPVGYVMEAQRRKVLQNAGESSGGAITEGQLTIMLFNALTVPQLVTMGYGSYSTAYVISGTEGIDEVTLLKNNLGFEKYRAKVVKAGDLTKDKEEGGTVISFLIDDDKIPGGYSFKNGEAMRLLPSEGISASGLTDTIQTIYTKEGVLYWMAEEKHYGFFYDFISEIDGEVVVEPDSLENMIRSETQITFLNNQAQYAFTEDTKVYIYLMGEEKPVEMSLPDTSFNTRLGHFAKAVVSRDTIFALYIYEMQEDMIVTSIEKNTITYDWQLHKELRIEELDYAKSITVILDGEVAGYEALEEDMLFSYWNGGDEHLICASSKFIAAPLNSISSDMVQVGERQYYLAVESFYSTNYGAEYKLPNEGFEQLLGCEVYAYLNLRGEIAYIKGESEAREFYGVVRRVRKNTLRKEMWVFRAVGSGSIIQGVNRAYALKLKDSPVSEETASAHADDPDGKGVYKFTLNSKAEIIKIEEPAWIPYFDQVDFPELSEYIFPAGNRNSVTGYYSSGSILSFDQTNNRLRYRPKVFTVDSSADSDGNIVGPRAGLLGSYKRESGSPAAGKLYVDNNGTPIPDDEIFINPQNLVPNVNTASGLQEYAYINDETRIISLVDNDGNFNPNVVSVNEIGRKNVQGVSMRIDASQPYTKLMVIISGKGTIENQYNARSGFVESMSQVIDQSSGEEMYKVTIRNDELLKKDYLIDPKNTNGIQKHTFIAYRENGIIVDPDGEDGDIPPDIIGDGTIRVMYTYNVNDIKNDGSNQSFSDAPHNSYSAYTDVVTSIYSYKRHLRYSAIEDMDDRIVEGVDYIDSNLIQFMAEGERHTMQFSGTALFYEYDPAKGDLKEGHISHIFPQSNKLWIIRRSGLIKAVIYTR